MVGAGDLWVADWNSYALRFLFGLARARFVVRQHGRLDGRLVGEKRAVVRTGTGAVSEQTIELADPDGGGLVGSAG